MKNTIKASRTLKHSVLMAAAVMCSIALCSSGCTLFLSPHEQETFLQAEAAYANGSYQEAATLLQAHVKRFPQDARGHLMLGLSLLKTDDLKGAVDHFKQSLELDPSNAQTPATVKTALFEKSETFENTGDKNGAMRSIMAYLTMFPDDVDALLFMTRSFFEIGQTRSAIAFMNRLVKLDPKNPELAELLELVDSGFH